MSVRENLQIGSYKLAGSQADKDRQLEKVFALFPRLKERISQTASSMSGGEQQMLAVGRALMANLKLLILMSRRSVLRRAWLLKFSRRSAL